MRRPGYTLVELLVVVGILAVLMGLVLVAVQKVRQAARVAENRNQVRQLMLAVHNYSTARDGSLPGDKHNHSFFNKLVVGDLTSTAQIGHPSFDVQITSSNYSLDGVHHGDPIRFATVIKLIVNPTDPSYIYYTSGSRISPGNCGYGSNPLAFDGTTKLQSSFADGTSNTVAVAERYSRCRDDQHPLGTDVVWCQPHASAGDRPSLSPRTPTFADAFYDDTRPAKAKDGRTVANRPGRPFQIAPAPADCDPFVPQATTPGGLVVGMVDGSVRTVGGGVNPDLFWAAVTPAAGDIGSLDD